MNKLLKSKLLKNITAVRGTIESKNECLQMFDNLLVAQQIYDEAIQPMVDLGIKNVELERQVKPHMASHSVQLGVFTNDIAVQAYDTKVDDNLINEDEEPVPPKIDPRFPGEKRVEKREPQTGSKPDKLKIKKNIGSIFDPRLQQASRNSVRSFQNTKTPSIKACDVPQLKLNLPDNSHIEEQYDHFRLKKDKQSAFKQQQIYGNLKDNFSVIVKKHRNPRNEGMIYESGNYLKTKNVNIENLPKINGTEEKMAYNGEKLEEKEENIGEEVCILSNKKSMVSVVKSIGSKQMMTNESKDDTHIETLDIDEMPTSEPNSSPKLDEAKMEKFNYTQPIVSLIKSLKKQDNSGQMQPIRECLEPKFGVKYHEPHDKERNLGEITIGGQSYQSNPQYKHRMRRHDLEILQLSERVNNNSSYEGISSKYTIEKDQSLEVSVEQIVTTEPEENLKVTTGSYAFPLTSRHGRNRIKLPNLEKSRVPSILQTPLFTQRSHLDAIAITQRSTFEHIQTPSLHMNSYLASMIERTDSHEQSTRALFSRQPTSINKTIYQEKRRTQQLLVPIFRGNSTQRTRNIGLEGSVKMEKVIQSHRYNIKEEIKSKKRWRCSTIENI